MTIESRAQPSLAAYSPGQKLEVCHGKTYVNPAHLTLRELHDGLDLIEDALTDAQNRHARHDAMSASFVGAAPVAFGVMLVQMVVSKQLDLAKDPWWGVVFATAWFAFLLWMFTVGAAKLWDHSRFGDDIGKLQRIRRDYRAVLRAKEAQEHQQRLNAQRAIEQNSANKRKFRWLRER